MKKMLSIVGFITALSFAVPAMAAYGDEGTVEAGVYGGYGLLLGDYGGLELKHGPLAGARVGYFIDRHISLEPSYQWLFTKTDLPAGNQNATLRSLRTNLLYNFLPDNPIRPFVTGGLGWGQTKVNGGVLDSHDLELNAGVGLRWMVREMIGARFDARYVHMDVGDGLNDRQHNIEFALGATFMFGGTPREDSDGDGVYDKNDKCPNTASGAKVDATGCTSDADGDGVPDGVDKCPNTVKGLIVDEKGCKQDTDKDGIPDGADRCPETPEGAKVNSFGCGVDADGDGIEDKVDKCPDTPKGASVDQKGCPLDSDGDGVANYLDKCAGTEAGIKVDENGCPLESKARGVLKGVNFKPSSSELTESSFATLDEVAATLNEVPEVKAEVQGHTDSQGGAVGNQKLSQKRAQAVADYLISKGVAPERLTVKGYGESNPIADNGTPQGRAENRRVELNWLD